MLVPNIGLNDTRAGLFTTLREMGADLEYENLREEGGEPVAFDHDCREGICGMCSMVINGRPHGPKQGVTTCQLHMRRFSAGDTVVVEPWRASAFPVINLHQIKELI